MNIRGAIPNTTHTCLIEFSWQHFKEDAVHPILQVEEQWLGEVMSPAQGNSLSGKARVLPPPWPSPASIPRVKGPGSELDFYNSWDVTFLNCLFLIYNMGPACIPRGL